MVTATTRIRLEKQEYASNDEAWGDHLNEGVFDRLDEAVAGYDEIALVGSYTLDVQNYITDEARNAVLKFTGTGTFTVTAPAVSKTYIVWNACTGDLTLKPSGGTGSIIRAGKKAVWFTDGTTGYTLDPTLDEIKTAAAAVALGGQKLTGVGTATDTNDATTLANKIHQFALPTSALAMNAQKITGLASGVDSTDAANVGQVAVIVQPIADAAQASAVAAAASAVLSDTSADDSAASASAAAASVVSAAAILDSFDDRYLGSKSADPTLDNDGNALLEGALYWNSVAKNLRAYNGTAWVLSGQYSLATASDVRAGTANKFIAPDTAVSAYAPVALTDGATITPDFDAGRIFSVTLGGNRTLANPTNLEAGQSGVVIVTQDGTGTRTLSFGTYWDFAGGAPAISTPANTVDVIAYYVRSTTSILCVLTKAYS
jgi:hypothetical protein